MNMAGLWSTWPHQAPSGLRVLTILRRSAAPVGQTSGSRCSSYIPSQKAWLLIWGRSLPKSITLFIIVVIIIYLDFYFFLPRNVQIMGSFVLKCWKIERRIAELFTQYPGRGLFKHPDCCREQFGRYISICCLLFPSDQHVTATSCLSRDTNGSQSVKLGS